MDNVINKATIVGTLIDASKLKTGIFKKGPSIGKQYISGEISIKAVLDGRENIIPVSLFTSEITQDGKRSKLFDTYSELPNSIGSRINVNGSLEEHRYVSGRSGEVVRTQRIHGRFINPARPNEADCATFELNGYVARGLEEKKNKAGEVYAIELVMGQANYKDDAAQMFYLNLPLDAVEYRQAMNDSYVPGVTATVEGDIRYITEQHTSEVDTSNDLFGTARPKVSIFTNKYFYISHATRPLAKTDPNAYTMQQMQKYKNARSAEDVRIVSEAKDKGTPTEDGALTNKASTLDSLL